MWLRLVAVFVVLLAPSLHAQGLRNAPPPDAGLPPPQHVRDARGGVSFDLSAGWNLTQKDGDLSTFALDARSAGAYTQMRDAAQLAFNPFPASTFSGAIFYFSVTPHISAQACANQAPAQHPRTVAHVVLDGVDFTHGYDEHGTICTEARDEIYTALRHGSCLRFDLVMNTFCGGDVSGVRSMTDDQIAAVRKRLEAVLMTVRIDAR